MLSSHTRAKKIYLSFLVASILGVTACETSEEMAESHLEKGKELFEKGEYNKAILELKTSSQSGDQRAETYYYMALLDEKNRDFKSMRGNLLKTIELDPKNLDARKKLVQVFLLFGDTEKALEQIEYLLENDPNNQEVKLLKASAYLKKGATEDALQIIDPMLEANPDNLEALTLKVAYFYETNQIDQALSVAGSVLERDAKNLSLRMFRIKINAKNNKIDAVIDDYKTLVQLFPDNDNFKLTLASMYSMSDKLQEAEGLLRDIVEQKPELLEPKLVLLEFLNAKAKDRVVAEFNLMLAHSNKKPALMLGLCKWMLRSGYLDAASAGLSQIVQLHDESKVGLAAETILAEIALNKKDYGSAEELIDKVLQADSDFVDASLVKAKLFLIRNNVDLAIDLLNKLVWSNKDSDNALALLGKAYSLKKDLKQADRYFKQALDIDPTNVQAFTPVYSTYLRANQRDVARQLLEKALQKKPNEVLFLTYKAELDILEKKWDDAQLVVQKLALFSKNKGIPLYLQANVFQGKGEFDRAISLYKKILVDRPNHINSMANLIRSFGMLKQTDEAVKFLEEHQAKNKDSLAISSMLSELYMANKDYAKAKQFLLEQIQKIPDNTVPLYLALAKVEAVSQKDNDEAIKEVYLKGLQANPDNPRLSMALAGLYSRTGDDNAARKIYEQIIEKYPNADLAINNLAAILIESDVPEDNAKGLALAARFKDADNVFLRDTYAWGLVKSGKTNEGLAILESVIVTEPKVPEFRYHLAVAHRNAGNEATAIMELKQAITLSERSKRSFSDIERAQKLLRELENR